MTEKEYFAHKGQHSSKLMQYYQYHQLLEIKPSVAMLTGHIFELLVECLVKKDMSKFWDKYFLIDAKYKMPDKFAEFIALDNELLTPEQVDYFDYELTPTGKLAKTAYNEYLDYCYIRHNVHGNKIPISTELFNQTLLQAWNTLELILPGTNKPLKELWKNAKWQVFIEWEVDGIKKVALLDVLWFMENENGKTMIYYADLKCYASHPKFINDYRYKLFVQDMHYTEGMQNYAKEWTINDSMYFIVSSKEKPYLAQPFKLDSQDIDDNLKEYQEISKEFDKWKEAGAKPRNYNNIHYLHRSVK